jgi:hypothetical protein
MQHEPGAAITCVVRTLAWMADGYAMLRIASAMTLLGERRQEDVPQQTKKAAERSRSTATYISDYTKIIAQQRCAGQNFLWLAA